MGRGQTEEGLSLRVPTRFLRIQSGVLLTCKPKGRGCWGRVLRQGRSSFRLAGKEPTRDSLARQCLRWTSWGAVVPHFLAVCLSLLLLPLPGTRGHGIYLNLLGDIRKLLMSPCTILGFFQGVANGE